MANELSCLVVSGRKSKPHHHVIQTALQLGQKVFTGDALLARGFLEVGSKLVFENAVDSFHLLFLAQLQAISDDLRSTGVSVLAGLKVSLLNGAGGFEAAFPFEE